MFTLGISAYYHNSAAAITSKGKIIAAAEEERFTRIKNDPSFPAQAIRYCLDEAGVDLKDIGCVVFYDKPFLKFERLIETYLSFAPHGLRSFLRAIPVWIREKIFLKDLLHSSLKKVGAYDKKSLKLLFAEHHLSHAASAYYPSPYQEAAIVTMDGIGEWATTTISKGEGAGITMLKEMHFPHSIGLLYSAFTYYCGFEVNSGEYKLMGLAPYGAHGSAEVEGYIEKIRSTLCTVYDDGSIFLHMEYFDFHTGLTMTRDDKWASAFGLARKDPDSPMTQPYCNLALAAQMVTEEIIFNLAREAQRITGSVNLCMAGGVALNCVANGKLLNKKIFSNIFVQPAAGDSGGAVGAALAADHIHFSQPRLQFSSQPDGMSGALLGPSYSADEAMRSIRKEKVAHQVFEDEKAMIEKVVDLIIDGKVIGWHQGRLEYGPRALGSRSIIADARRQDMQKILNLKVKFRESFRPFAPMILAEYAEDYFGLTVPSPYMLLALPIREEKRLSLPVAFEMLSPEEKLRVPKSELSAATHVDMSCRIQTVHREVNPLLWKLLSVFHKRTGCPALINTSFNIKDEPIVNTPADALRCFLKTGIDHLVIGNVLVNK